MLISNTFNLETVYRYFFINLQRKYKLLVNKLTNEIQR